jgi:hypothetical protein
MDGLISHWWVFVFQLQRHDEAGGWIYHTDWLMGLPTQTGLRPLSEEWR